MDLIRFLDILFACFGIVVFSPFYIIISIIIKLTSKGPVLYNQTRVGLQGKDFKVHKFRSMYMDADKRGFLTVGGRDPRVTAIGYYLRKFKLDELPQLFNVLKGDMSFVGPRPEVRKYVDLYTQEQRQVLTVLPGITDYASITYRNENDLLAAAADPEALYIQEIMPHKIALNQQYISQRSVRNYFSIILKTVITSLKGR
jgi:lipopolysaccharide/colanic/teichoic acid biosynthesis glycosyltransferase